MKFVNPLMKQVTLGNSPSNREATGSVEQIVTVGHIKHSLISTGEREVSRFGEMVMEHLALDHVAYVRRLGLPKLKI